MSIDEQFANFENLLRGLYTANEELRAEIRSLKMGERISFNLREVSNLTGLSYETLFNKCKAGRIPYCQDGPGSSIIVKRIDVERFLNELNTPQEVEPVPLHGAALKAVRGR